MSRVLVAVVVVVVVAAIHITSVSRDPHSNIIIMPYFNKMFVMIPVMLAARKLDGDDPATVTRLRIAYGVVQTLCLLIVLYTYVRAQAVTSTKVIYVPPPAVVRGLERVVRGCIYRSSLILVFCAPPPALPSLSP